MTRTDCEMVAEVLRRRIVEIGKMFEPPDARVPDVEKAMKIQILVAAHDIGIAFAKEDPQFDSVLVEAVQAEINRAR
jgi:hypothetical protein